VWLSKVNGENRVNVEIGVILESRGLRELKEKKEHLGRKDNLEKSETAVWTEPLENLD